jgi:outer membrane immunogenic protein
MNKFFGTVAISVLLAAPALAADMRVPVKAPPAPVPVAVATWSGCYIGVAGGYAWARDDVDWLPNPAGFPASGPLIAANSVASIDGDGGIVGGTIGCNLQAGAWVFGVEGDGSWTGVKGTRDVRFAFAGANIDIHEEYKVRWLATARGRLGITAGPNTLLFVTGGAAFAGVKTTDSVFFPLSGTTNAVTDTTTKFGWTVGGGIEHALGGWGGWSIKAEYLFVHLPEFSTNSRNSDVINFPTLTIQHRHQIDMHIARVGLNYRFGGSPVVARY